VFHEAYREIVLLLGCQQRIAARLGHVRGERIAARERARATHGRKRRILGIFGRIFVVIAVADELGGLLDEVLLDVLVLAL
jgi:hypothetical protein